MKRMKQSLYECNQKRKVSFSEVKQTEVDAGLVKLEICCLCPVRRLESGKLKRFW